MVRLNRYRGLRMWLPIRISESLHAYYLPKMGPGHATCHSRSHLRYSLINSLLLYISSLPRCSSSCVFFLLFKLWVATCWVTAGGIRETKLIKKTGDGDDTALCESFFRSFKSPELISLIQAGREEIYLFIYFWCWILSECCERKKAAGIESQRSTFRYTAILDFSHPICLIL